MKNEVIKVLTREHGARVIQYWKDRGVDTREHLGAVSESNGNGFIYYGVIEGKFDNYSLQQVHDYNADVIELPNEEPVFKVGDKVYHFTHGWGIIDVLDSFVTVSFNDKKIHFNHNTQLLSFTEYTLQGFSQERPIELPEVGELCLFYDNGWEEEDYQCGVFKEYEKGDTHPYRTTYDDGYQAYKRIKILD